MQIDVLQRAAVGHAVLGPVVMAWRQAGTLDPRQLREKLEEFVAEGMVDSQNGRRATAWVAAGQASAGWEERLAAASSTEDIAQGRSQASTTVAAVAAGPAAHAGQGALPLTRFGCGETAHKKTHCPKRKGGGPKVDKMDEVLNKRSEMMAELRRVADSVKGQPKK